MDFSALAAFYSSFKVSNGPANNGGTAVQQGSLCHIRAPNSCCYYYYYHNRDALSPNRDSCGTPEIRALLVADATVLHAAPLSSRLLLLVRKGPEATRVAESGFHYQTTTNEE